MQPFSSLAMLHVPPNDWPVKRLIAISAVILAIAILLEACSLAGLQIPVITQLVGYILITFVPGLLMLRILRLHNTGFIECIGYSVGLSLALAMAIMAAINFILPSTGIVHPLSQLPVFITFAIMITALGIPAYIRDKDFSYLPCNDRQQFYWPPVLFLLLLLLLTILAAKIADTYNENALLIICLVVIAVVFILAAFGKFIRSSQYPFFIFTASLCLLYQTTLMTPYLIGSDIYTEYFIYNLVARNGIWDPGLMSIVNSCLSITMLAPLYSLLMNIDGVWVFKAVYPLIYALVPVILFHIIRLQVGSRIALLSVFFFVVVPTFSLEMISLCRQQVAELFLVLVILLLVERRLSILPKVLLLIIFAAGIIVSHYGIGTIGLIYMVLLTPLVLTIVSGWFRRIWAWLSGDAPGLPTISLALPIRIMAIFVAFFIGSGLYWFFITSSGINFTRLLDFVGQHSRDIAAGIFQIHPANNSAAALTDFSIRDGLIRTALGLDFLTVSLQGQIFRILQYATQLLLVLGILRFIFRPGGYKFVPEFLALSLSSIMLLAACIILPGFAERFNTTRMYHLALLTLSPFMVIGCQAVAQLAISIRNVIKRHRVDIEGMQSILLERSTSFIAVIVLVPYFIFCSGLVFELTGQKVTDRIDTPYSNALSRYRLDLTGSFSARDGAAAHWLSTQTTDSSSLFTDHHAGLILQFNSVPGRRLTLEPSTVSLPSNSYIFLTAWNTSSMALTYATAPGLRTYINLNEIPLFNEFRDNMYRIYCDGGAQVFLVENKY
ncbi:MAG: DUF2206 domain-containing protein [Chloroflexi bacterium]|nr:DUF2206 domain-containing protein [Chloroflexota bacterium]